MANENETLEDRLYGDLPPRRRLWLQAYLNSENPATYLNKTESASVAGYEGDRQQLSEQGCRVSRFVKDRIQIWLDEVGLSDETLRSKLAKGLDVEQTEVITVRGDIDESELPDGVRIVAKGKQERQGKEGTHTEQVTVLAMNMAAIEVRRKFLEMAMRTKGMFNDDKSTRPVINVNLDSRIKKGETEDEGEAEKD